MRDKNDYKPHWKYHYEKVEPNESAIMKCLNQFGDGGWTPISIIYTPDNKATIYFKSRRYVYDT